MRAAFYECDITPPLGGFLWGHYHRVFATDVQDRLYAKAVVVENEGTVSAIVCVDSCALPPQMHDAVTERITEYTGIPAENVCLTSNHTHWGAPISDGMDTGCLADASYRDVCFRLTADAVILAYMRLKDVKATYGTSVLEGVSFNRNYVLENGIAITWGKSPLAVDHMLAGIDPTVSVMTFYQGDQPIGAVVNFALHQCCCGNITAYTGDFSSILSKELKKKYGEDFVSLFVLGCCGDINHVNDDRVTKATPDSYREIGRRLAEKTEEAMASAKPVDEGVQVVKEKLRVETRQAETEETNRRVAELLDVSMMRLRNLVYYQATNTDTYKDLWVQAFKIGNVCIYALPGEVFVNHGLRLKKESPYGNCFVIENCNSYCGYIPTEEAFGENCQLYETSLCYHSCLVPEAGSRLVEKALELAKKL
ncbi:MAG: hypothetical protein IJY47_04235 [Clostridia bacterium]|nr:hypothetical protein [Clostridia bacterium]